MVTQKLLRDAIVPKQSRRGAVRLPRFARNDKKRGARNDRKEGSR